MPEQIKVSALVNTNSVVNFIGLGVMASLLPFMIHLQGITGPIINAILIIAIFVVGIRGALSLCLIPSLVALTGGLLPVALAPMVPFIMISNTILVLAVDYFVKIAKREAIGYWIGVLAGAFLKFIFLFASVNFIAKLLPNPSLTLKVAQMMSWPQFFSAAAGGVLAWGVLKWLKRI